MTDLENVRNSVATWPDRYSLDVYDHIALFRLTLSLVARVEALESALGERCTSPDGRTSTRITLEKHRLVREFLALLEAVKRDDE